MVKVKYSSSSWSHFHHIFTNICQKRSWVEVLYHIAGGIPWFTSVKRDIFDEANPNWGWFTITRYSTKWFLYNEIQQAPFEGQTMTIQFLGCSIGLKFIWTKSNLGLSSDTFWPRLETTVEQLAWSHRSWHLWVWPCSSAGSCQILKNNLMCFLNRVKLTAANSSEHLILSSCRT